MPPLEYSQTQESLAQFGARAILAAFDEYQAEFKQITRRAKGRFESRDWHGTQKDAVERLELYKKVIQKIVAQVKEILGDQVQNTRIWIRMKPQYSGMIPEREDIELAETFFNSVTRRIFTTVGVDPDIEFIDSDFETLPGKDRSPIYASYALPEKANFEIIQDLIVSILASYSFTVPYADASRDAALAAQEILSQLEAKNANHLLDRVEILHPVFYRGSAAYLIGRICHAPCTEDDSSFVPLLICLINTPSGIATDAILTAEDDVSIIFSFTRSYFHVDVERPHELVAFLKSIMPLKRIAELYISIGFNKHGKTELYRELIHHLANSTDKFKIARGERGMVMIVFAMDSFDMVFKIIKDRVDPPKTATRQEVMERYDLVFKHDRAGRLVDAQEFEYLSFDKHRFSEELLEQLLAVAPNVVRVDHECVIIKHLYIERRLTPLNLYVKEAGEAAAREAVIDYGKAIKDLAATNIFPGDVLLKNFGVTRHGRVVFYDYDELCLVTDCKFRKMPLARNFDEEFESDAWFYVGPLDIFPEEFRTFLGLLEPLRSTFVEVHEDLFGIEFWRSMQRKHASGEYIHIYPYPESKRLHLPE